MPSKDAKRVGEKVKAECEEIEEEEPGQEWEAVCPFDSRGDHADD